MSLQETVRVFRRAGLRRSLALCLSAACGLACAAWAGRVSAQTACAAPRVRVKTLLDGVGVGPGGHLSLGRLYAVCLPDPARRGETNYAYNPYDGGKLSTVLKSSNGQALNTYVWYAEKIAGLWELSRYEVVGGPKAVKPLAPGSYVLEFAVEDKVFQRFPFSVSTAEGKDVYRPETVYLLDGPWGDYAELYFPKPDRFTQLWVWLRDKENAGPRPREIQYELKLVREADGKTLATDAGALRLEPQWAGLKLSFNPAGVPLRTTEFPASEVLKADGVYRIELSLGGKPYGVYRVAVKGGKFQRDAADARAAEGALMPLENEANYWSLKRSTR
jgi:hypothetical protein